MSETNEASPANKVSDVERVVMPLVKWRTGRGSKIERIECTKETEKCVWLVRWEGQKPSRCDKDSSFYQYHDTWDGARDYLMEKAERGVASARRTLEVANGFLGNVNGLRKPEGA